MIRNNYIKIILNVLAIVLLLIASQKLKYTQYELIRYLLFAIFAISGYLYYKLKFELLSVFYMLLALLFQPFIKVSFGREIWQIIDILLAAFVFIITVIEIILSFKKSKLNKS